MPPAVLFATESSESRSLPLSAQRLVNFFTEAQRPGAKSQTPLFGAPGLSNFANVGLGPVRGAWIMRDVLYVVSGSELYTINAAGAGTLLGTAIAGTQVVGMADNGHQLCIVNGVNGWIYTIGGAMVQITDSAFRPANTVQFFDGYFVFDAIGTNEYFISGLYDGLSYNGLDFATAEAQADFVVGTVQNLQLLFVIGQQHIELWYDAGTANFPFQRYSGGVINYGCVAPHTILKQDGAIFFLGSDKVFYRLQANEAIRVSTHEMEHIIAQDADLSQATACTYTLEGHKFIVLTLTASNRTLKYDISTQRWHERESWDSHNTSLGRWRGNVAVRAYNQTYIGDAFDGRVGMVDWSTYTEYGNTIRGLIYSAPIHADRKRVFISRFELDIQAGVGLTSDQGSDPQLMLRWSKDGANTWSMIQPWRSMGKIGEYLRRVRWLQLGNAYQWCFELSVTDAVPRVIIAAHADWDIGV